MSNSVGNSVGDTVGAYVGAVTGLREGRWVAWQSTWSAQVQVCPVNSVPGAQSNVVISVPALQYTYCWHPSSAT